MRFFSQTSEIREAFNIQLDDASTRENGIPPGSIFRVPISVLTYLIIGMIALAQACYIPLTYLLYKVSERDYELLSSGGAG